jgi:hypothetical protein
MFAFLTSRAGQLTPEEFVACGDALCDASKTWEWRSAAPSSLSAPSLPLDKQYLFAAGLSVNSVSVSGVASSGHNDGGFSLISADDGGGGGGGGGAGAAVEPPAPGCIDVTLCYDFWYRVPHAYFSSASLTPQQVLALASADMSTTATLAKHPFASATPQCVSLHPCKISSVLQAFPDKAQALVVFLKVVQHALPGLALDGTWGV